MVPERGLAVEQSELATHEILGRHPERVTFRYGDDRKALRLHVDEGRL